MSYVLLERSADFLPLLRYVVLIGSVIVGVALVFSNVNKASVQRGALIAALVALALGLAGPAAYAIDTATSSSSGSIPSAGPAGAGGFGPGGGMRMDGRGTTPPGMTGRQGTPAGMTGQQGVPNQAVPQANPMQRETGRGMGGGGLLEGSKPTDELVAILDQNADDFTWVAAAIGSNTASGYQLATEHSVMPIGGFNGSDPSPTLAQFQQYVADGEIHYFIAGGGGMMGGGTGTASEITAWVEANFTSTTVGSVTLYDLTDPD
jgi:4-amino-4-deoxy-L-arabinose transferase-like glycosyltransferase